MTFLPKRRKPLRMAHKDETVIRCPQHLQWVRGHECSIAGTVGILGNVIHKCSGNIEAAHVRRGGNAGTGIKPGDDRAIPLCSGAHRQQHSIGELSFELCFNIHMAEIAAELWRTSPHGIKYRAKSQP